MDERIQKYEDKMKKTLALLLAVLMLVSVLSACGTTAETPAAPTAEATAETMGTETPEEESALEAQDLIFATMDVGTSIYTYSSAIANILLEYLPEGSTIDVPTTSPGGLGAAYLLAQGKSDLIIVNDVGFISSIEGGVLGEASIDSNLVAGIVGSMDWPHVDILVRNDYAEKNGVNSIEEVIEKKIPTNFVIKQAGTMGELAFVQLLEGLGVTEEELTGWGCTITRTASGNIKTAMQDGTGDITVDHPPNNQANTVELTLNTPCTLWDVPESVRDYMESKGWTKTTWKAGTSGFTGHDEDIQTVSSSNVVVCRRDLDEEVVYLITKAICESGDELAAASSALAEFDPSIGWVTMEKYMHPGAIRYYKEMGYMP